MPDDRGMTRRKAMGLGAAAIGSVAAYDILAGPARALAATGPGTTAGIGYFARFGVTEKLIQATLGEALSSGGDFADVFFQHQVGEHLPAGGRRGEPRPSPTSSLGVGVRVVKGDQTGYGFTEDLTPEGLRLAAKTAAAIATGPSRPAPVSFRATGGLPARDAVKTRWEDVRPETKLPLLRSVNEKAMGADPRVRKVRVYFVDESGAMLLADSNGQIVEDLQPMTTMGLTCIAEQDGKREENSYNAAARDDISFYSPERIDRMVRECVKNTMILFGATPAPGGRDAGGPRRRLVGHPGSTRPSATGWRQGAGPAARTTTRSACRASASAAAGAASQPAGEMNIAGNMLELLKKLTAVGNDPGPYSSMRTPTLVFEGVQLAGYNEASPPVIPRSFCLTGRRGTA